MEVFNTDAAEFGGSGETKNGKVLTNDYSMHGYEQSISINIPPMSVLYFKHTPVKKRKPRTKKAEVETTAVEKTEEAPKKRGRKPKAETAPAAEKKTSKAKKEAAPAEAPKKRGRKPKSES